MVLSLPFASVCMCEEMTAVDFRDDSHQYFLSSVSETYGQYKKNQQIGLRWKKSKNVTLKCNLKRCVKAAVYIVDPKDWERGRGESCKQWYRNNVVSSEREGDRQWAPYVFTALHGMQTRSSDISSVCLSVRPSVKRGRKIWASCIS